MIHRAAASAASSRRSIRSMARAAWGFTMLELLIVCFISAIIVGLGLACIGEAYALARRAEALETIHQIYNGCDTYRIETGDFPPVEPLNRISYDDELDESDPSADPHVLNAIHHMCHFDPDRLGEDDTLRDPWGNPYIYQRIDETEGDAATVASGVWWADRGLTHPIKIYSVGGALNFDASATDSPYWIPTESDTTGTEMLLYVTTGQ